MVDRSARVVLLNEGVSISIGEILDMAGGSSSHIRFVVDAAQQATLLSEPLVDVVSAPGDGKIIVNVRALYQKNAASSGNPQATELRLFYSGTEAIAVGLLPPPGPAATVVEGTPGDGGSRSVEAITGLGLSLTNENNDWGLAGPISASSLNSGGSGYAPGDTFNFDPNFDGDALAAGTVDTVDGDGAVLTYHLTALGVSFAADNDVSADPLTGAGTGLRINITAVTSDTADLTFDVWWDIIDAT